MKKLLVIFLILFATYSVFSQIPKEISWQGILQDAQSNNLNGAYTLTIKLFNAETGGTALWTETFQDLSISDGLVNLVLGEKTALNISFNQQYWMEITVGTGTPLSRIKLTSTPYSLYSQKSSGVIVGDSLVLKDSLGVTRFVLNPNTGTFKMMNKDTVWYSLSVNSPVEEYIQNKDGSTTILKGNSDGSSYKAVTYSISKKKLNEVEVAKTNYAGTDISTKIIRMYDNNETLQESHYFETKHLVVQMDLPNWNKEIHNYYSNSTLVSSVEIEDVFDGNTKIGKKRSVYNADGKLLKEEFEKDMKIEKTFYSTQGPPYKLTDYKDMFWKEVEYNGKGTITYQDSYSSSFQKKESESLLETKYTDDELPGYELSYYNVTTGTPYSKIEFNQYNGNGYIIFSGKANFNNSITVSGNSIVTGNSSVTGNLNVTGTKNFLIDHPKDPYNKYLVHAAIESNEVLNTYTGNVITDENGVAVVNLPEYFEAINKDFRYQLTTIGKMSGSFISKEINNNKFEITTEKPNVKVSWQVTAKRNDEVMIAKPFKDVMEKEIENKGKLLFTK